MSFAIIRNIKHKQNTLNLAYRHNERRNTNYSNKNIDKSKEKQNYSIVHCPIPYSKKFKIIKDQYNLKGQLKTTSNLVCEYLITSDKDFFDEIGPEKTKRYFETAYKFVCNYKNLGKEFILSAKVHMDETTPHMHLVFLPVVHTKDKNGNSINKLSCSEFWKGKNSYKSLQDSFYKYMIKSGFDLERGKNDDNEHIPIEQLKVITNHELQQFESQTLNTEQELNTDNIEELRQDYKRIIKKFNTLAKQYTKIKVINNSTVEKVERLEHDYNNLENEYFKTRKKLNSLTHYLNKTFEYVSLLFDFPINRLKRLINNYILKENKENEKFKQ